MQKKVIREYYKKADLVLKPNSQWRVHKLQLLNGRWINVRDQITNSEKLRKILIKETPLNVFSSTSAWLNPLNVERPSYRYADRILLSNLLFIDIDEHNPIVLDAVIRFFDKNPRYKRWKAKDSGNGYGVYYQDTKRLDEPNPKKRLKALKVERMSLMLEMARKGISNFDWRMIIDPFRVSRVIGTLNEGEKLCKEITIPLETEESPERPKADEGGDIISNTPTTKYWKSAPAGLSASSTYYFPFIDSQIYGIKGKHSVHIVKRKEMGYNIFKKIIKKLQQIYRLSDFYVFETKKYYSAICLKGVDNSRFIKILRAAKASNLNPFQKYHHSWIRTGRSIGNKEDLIDKPPVFIDIIEKEEYRESFHSAPHLNYLYSLGVQPRQYPHLFGDERNPKMIAEVKV